MGITLKGSITVTSGNKSGSVLELDDGSLLLGTFSKFEVYKSVDNGATWTRVYYNIDNWASRVTRLLHITSNGNIYFGCGSTTLTPGYVIRSTDNGDTWSVVLTVESNAVWNMSEDSTGRLYINEYSMGAANDTELYAYNVWRSADDGLTWSKFYSFPPQSTPGAKDSTRHVHLVAVDSDDNVYVTVGDTWSVWTGGGKNYVLNTSGEVVQDLGIEGNGYCSWVELEDGTLLFGGDAQPNSIYRITDRGTFTRETVLSLGAGGHFGSAPDTAFLGMCLGKYGVVYAVSNGNGANQSYIFASPDGGDTWVMLDYSATDTGSTYITCNRNTSRPKVLMDQTTSKNFVWFYDMTPEQLIALAPSTLTIKQG